MWYASFDTLVTLQEGAAMDDMIPVPT